MNVDELSYDRVLWLWDPTRAPFAMNAAQIEVEGRKRLWGRLSADTAGLAEGYYALNVRGPGETRASRLLDPELPADARPLPLDRMDYVGEFFWSEDREDAERQATAQRAERERGYGR